MEALEDNERKGLRSALIAMLLAIVFVVVTAWPGDSAWRSADGVLTSGAAPLMRSIVPLIFLFFLLPGVVYGISSGTIKTSRDMIAGMTTPGSRIFRPWRHSKTTSAKGCVAP